jgi:dienelactone hydrolase
MHAACVLVSGLGLVVSLALTCGKAGAAPVLPVASLDVVNGAAVVLPGHWFAAPNASPATPAPAMLLLHGCGGFFDRQGRLGARYLDLAARLNARGIHALAVDSLTPRGETELCTQRLGARQVTMTQRRRDALGALAWLAAQPTVDASRIGVLGWSNGGSAVLASTNAQHAEVQAAAVKAALAVAFYPGCESELKRGYRPVAPLLLLLGEADDWTPAAPCKQLAGSVAATAPAVQWQAYAGAYHGFDGTAPVRVRNDVPNGVNPGAGVHVGGNPEAREASAQRLLQFLNDNWKLKP